jgi:hypothetical protein
MEPVILPHCEDCFFWKKLDGQTERPFWGLCTATRGNTLRRYMRPVPEKLETVGPFSCAAFQPSQEAVRKAAAGKG